MFWKTEKDRQFRRLVEQQAGRLFRLAYGRLSNRQDAEDVVQEAFLKAHRAFGTLRQGSNEAAWVTTILINTIRDHVRKTQRMSTISLDQAEDADRGLIEDRSTPSVEQALIDNEIDEPLQEALRSLPESFLTPVLLRDLHDFSYQQIADVLDVPIGTVMSRLSRGRQMLREKLKSSSGGKESLMVSP